MDVVFISGNIFVVVIFQSFSFPLSTLAHACLIAALALTSVSPNLLRSAGTALHVNSGVSWHSGLGLMSELEPDMNEEVELAVSD